MLERLVRPLTQDKFLNLSGGSLRQWSEYYCGRHLKMCQMVAAKLDNICTVYVARIRFEINESKGCFPPFLVILGDNCGFLYAGMAVKHILDLDAGDILPTGDDYIFGAVLEFDVTVLMHNAEITSVEPPASKYLLCLSRIGEIAVFGFREADGKRTTNTEVLDGFLISALVSSGASVASGIGVADTDEDKAGKKWKKGEWLPSDWKESSSPYLLSGHLRYHNPWVYASVRLTDRDSGAVIESWLHRFSERELEIHARELIKARGRQEAAVQAPTLIEVDLHIIARHMESGFVEWFEPTDGGRLQPGDRLQLRFRVRSDCAVYAILYQSDGEWEPVFESEVVYPGRLYYAPGEEQWITVNQENEVYTLYVIAAPAVEEDRADLFNELSELVRRGQIDRFQGLELFDGVVADFFGRTETGELVVIRGDDVERGKVETFVYRDGENVDSRPRLLSGLPAVVRGLSFEVQYE